MTQRIMALAVLVLFCSAARADVITLEGGRVVEGQVLQSDDNNIALKLDHAVAVLPRSMVTNIRQSPPASSPRPKPAKGSNASAAARPRIPTWDALITALAKQKWATGLVPVPATVVDKGQMKFVPYSSYRCGDDYEINLYGDPDAPAAVEVGLYRDLLKSGPAKANAIEFIAAVLNDRADGAALRKLDREKARAVRNGLTLEIVPEAAEGASGAWWVRVSDEKALDAARASGPELEGLIVSKSPRGKSLRSPQQLTAALTGDDASESLYDWQPDDLRRARPAASESDRSGGNVYLRGYTRREGTYVGAHARGEAK